MNERAIMRELTRRRNATTDPHQRLRLTVAIAVLHEEFPPGEHVITVEVIAWDEVEDGYQAVCSCNGYLSPVSTKPEAERDGEAHRVSVGARPVPNTKEANIAFRKAWDARFVQGQNQEKNS